MSKSIADLGGLLPGTYQLVAGAGNRIGILPDVEVTATSEVSDLRVEIRPGARVRIRYDGGEEYCHFRVLHAGIPVAFDDVRKGTSSDHTVPAGKCTVEIEVAGGFPKETFELDLAVGELGEVVLEPGG